MCGLVTARFSNPVRGLHDMGKTYIGGRSLPQFLQTARFSTGVATQDENAEGDWPKALTASMFAGELVMADPLGTLWTR